MILFGIILDIDFGNFKWFLTQSLHKKIALFIEIKSGLILEHSKQILLFGFCIIIAIFLFLTVSNAVFFL